MAAFKKGDIVFVIEDGFQKRMTVKCVHEYEVDCEYNGSIETFDETDLTLFDRPGIKASQVEEERVQDSSEVHVKNDLTGELLGYGKLYEYDDQLWIVFKGNVYPAEKLGEQDLVFNKEEEPWIAVIEEDEIDQQDSDNC